MNFYKILIVEDDHIIGSTLKEFFEDNHFKVIHVASGEEAIDVYKKEPPSIVLLDVKLPGDMDGFEVIEKIRERDVLTPVIMMTGSEYDENSQVKGYNNRATNYLQKPVVPQILLAQINTLLNPPETKKFYPGSYTITIQNRDVMINDELYTLREKDIVVLSLLLQKMNYMVSREELIKLLGVADNERSENILDSSISAIRRILKKHPGIEITNIYREGYKLEVVTVNPYSI